MVLGEPPLFPSLQWWLVELGVEVALVQESLDAPSLPAEPSVVVLNTFSAGPQGREELMARVRQRLPGRPVIELRQGWERANESTAELCLDDPFSVDDLVTAARHLVRSEDR